MLKVEVLRRTYGLNQAELGKLTRMSQNYISLMELARYIPTQAQLLRLGGVLNARPETLLRPVTVQEESAELLEMHV